MFTRRDWKERTDKGAAAQIDFAAASHSLKMTQSAVDGHTDFSSDHSLVHAEFSGLGLPVKRERPTKTSLLNWCPAVSWFEVSV